MSDILPPISYREFDDTAAMRRNIYDRAKSAYTSAYPIENTQYRLELADVDYPKDYNPSYNDQKKAIMAGKTLSRPLKGTWRLYDKTTNELVDERAGVKIANVPHVTERGTFIFNGNEYSLANQMRLKPGVYTRKKETGELESHFNIMPGSGTSFRVFLEPETGIFKMHVGQSNFPLYPVLRALGKTDKELSEIWGRDLLAANALDNDEKYLKKAHEKLTGRKLQLAQGEVDPNTPVNYAAEVAAAMEKMELDPAVMKVNLGMDVNKVSADVIKEATKKLIAINKGTADTDDRDNVAFQRVYGPEDFIAERILKDAGRVSKNALWKATWRRNLDPVVNADVMRSKQLQAVLLESGLGQPLEETNPLDVADQLGRISRLGAGGIPTTDSVPDESRSVQPSYLAFVDPIRTPESEKVGVDNKLAYKTVKGDDGYLYSPLRTKAGKVQLVPSAIAASATIAFPGEVDKARKEGRKVRAMSKGKMKLVSPDQVDYEIPSYEQILSPHSHLVPFVSAINGQRMNMGTRMLNQALALKDAESPLVQCARESDIPDDSFERYFGSKVGAVRADYDGMVKRITSDSMIVTTNEGDKEVPLYNNFPFNRRSFISTTPTVQVGQQIKKGDLLARSNFTDGEGKLAIGKNMRIGFINWRGNTYEDAIIVSESAAKRFTSEHMYQNALDIEPGQKISKSAFVAKYPTKFTKAVIDNFDDDGVIKPGTVVKKGDPLVLSIGRRQPKGQGVLHKSGKEQWSDNSLTWDHEAEGVVTDVHLGPRSANVVVKAYMPLLQGDKLCYSPDTEILTREGWKKVTSVTPDDLCATIDTAGMLDYINPLLVSSHLHNGEMYALDTTQVSLLVTPEHNLYAKRQDYHSYSLIKASELFGKRYKLKNNATWAGRDIQNVALPGYVRVCGQGGKGIKTVEPLVLLLDTYLALLGAYLSEGSSFDSGRGGSGIEISQTKEPNKTQLIDMLDSSGLHYCNHKKGVRLYGKHLYNHFSEFGYSYEKYIPNWVFDCTPDKLKILYDWLMWGDGHAGKTCDSYHTASPLLADDFQRLCLHLGLAAKVTARKLPDNEIIKGKPVKTQHVRYLVSVYKNKNEPEINHAHCNTQKGQNERFEAYCGPVYCVSLPVNHTLYVRRNGKACWSGNSGLYGNKGVISEILPDDKMPKAEDGRPLEVMMQPYGIISRINPAFLLSSALGKVAEKTGKNYKVKGFSDDDYSEFVRRELQKNGMSSTEDLTDPTRNIKIPKVFVGNSYLLKLQHIGESKLGYRGDEAAYTSDMTPSKAGDEATKRIGQMETTALLSSGAVNVLRDAKLVRGQKNDDFWRAFKLGYPPPTPKVPFVYNKFFDGLKAAGINVNKQGNYVNIMALTDKDVEKLSRGEIKNAETLDFDTMNPIPGGFFDLGKTGGHQGLGWSHVQLDEPIPNPVMEDPIRRLLGLTTDKYRKLIQGKETYNDLTGPKAIKHALEKLNVDKEIALQEHLIKDGPRSKRDAAVKKLRTLHMFNKTGIKPVELMLSKIPVLPPQYRPISRMGERTLISHPNSLYKELMLANDNLRDVKKELGDSSAGDERLALYDSYAAITGLADPIQPKLQQQGVKGILAHALGIGSSPKFGDFQRKVLNTSVDLVGRAVIIPDSSLSMDQVGIPEETAWTMYKPFIIRNLVRRGTPAVQAVQMANNHDPKAKEALLSEMAGRPVVYNRAPTLHRYGFMAAYPVLVNGSALRVSPLTVSGFGADFDGDAEQFHVPVSDDAVREAKEKLLPSKNLLSASTFKVHYAPTMEFVQGLYNASTKDNKKEPRRFATKQDAIRAYYRGEIGVGERVTWNGD